MTIRLRKLSDRNYVHMVINLELCIAVHNNMTRKNTDFKLVDILVTEKKLLGELYIWML